VTDGSIMDMFNFMSLLPPVFLELATGVGVSGHQQRWAVVLG